MLIHLAAIAVFKVFVCVEKTGDFQLNIGTLLDPRIRTVCWTERKKYSLTEYEHILARHYHFSSDGDGLSK